MSLVTRTSVILASLLAAACAADPDDAAREDADEHVGTTSAALSGDLDSSFDGNGMRLTAYPGADSYEPPYAIWGYPTIHPAQTIGTGGVETSSGYLLVAGSAKGRMAMARHLPNGALDMSFGSANNGWQTWDIAGTDYDAATSIAIQTDGKLVLGGYACVPTRVSMWNNVTYCGSRFVVARVTTNGDRDPSFGGDGLVVHNFASSAEGVNKVLVQRDGKILAVGWADSRVAMTRYLTDGSVDTSFGGGDGVVIAQHESGVDSDAALSAALQADGKIVVSGFSKDDLRGETMLVRRFNADGSLDTAFGSAGSVHITNGRLQSVAIASDGKIVAAGWSRSGRRPGSYDKTDERKEHVVAVVRLTTTGALDTTWSGDGLSLSDFTSTGTEEASVVRLTSDNKVLVAGNAGTDIQWDNGFMVMTGEQRQFALARFTSTGYLDTSFNGDGKLLTDFVSGSERAHALLFTRNDTLTAIGAGDNKLAIARYSR